MHSSISDEQLSIASLAHKISDLSAQVSSLLKQTNAKEPSFAASSPEAPETAEYEALRAPLNDAALDLLRLINGPKNTLRSFYFTHYDLAALQVALDRNFFGIIPLNTDKAPTATGNGTNGHAPSSTDDISVEYIAEKAGMDVDRASRILRILATQRIFEEVPGKRGMFRHTSHSALLAANEDWNAMAAMQMDELFRAASETSAEIARNPSAADSTNTAVHARFDLSLYEYYALDPAKSRRFTQAMGAWSKMDRQIASLRDGFDWGSLKNKKVVDIGGGSGYASVGVARNFPDLTFVVQDLFNNMQHNEAIRDLGDRATFQKHDFFEPQPVDDAGVLFLRQCLHNYRDEDCVKILKALCPALERNPSMITLINDIILPEGGEGSRFEEQYLRQIDITMLVVLGSKERTELEFRALLQATDPRFKVVNVRNNPFGVGLIEVKFEV